MSQDLLDPSYSNVKGKGTLPNSTTVLVLGILSIVGCMLYAIPGLICGIIALIMHKKDREMYLSNPPMYEESFKSSKAGNICAIVGVSLSAVFVLILVVYFIWIFTVLGAVTSAASFR